MTQNEQTFLDIVTAPTLEPITVAEAKSHLRVTGSTLDADIAVMIQSAREFVEQFTARAIVTQTRRLDLPCFDERTYLPGGRVQSVSHVKYIDTAGTLQTLGTSSYALFSTSKGASYIDRAFGATWPTTRAVANAVQITYVAGFPGTGSPADLRGGVPASIKQAIKKLVQAEYDDLKAEDREALVKSAKVLLWPHRLLSF